MTSAEETIVVGVDGSDTSLEALRWAVDEGTRRGCAVEAVTVWGHDPALAAKTAIEADVSWLRSDPTQRDRYVRALAESLTTNGNRPAEVRQLLVQGWAPNVLTRLAGKAGLLVLGAPSAVHVAGTVTGYCLRHARCPVVVVPHPRTE